MKYSKSYQSGHNEPVVLASSGTKPNITKPNITKPKKQKNTPYGNKKEEFRRENAIKGTAGPGAECAHDAGYTGSGMHMHICSSDAPYCMNYVENVKWGKCMKTPTGATVAAKLPGTPAWCAAANTDCRRGLQSACYDLDNHCSKVVSATAVAVHGSVQNAALPWLPSGPHSINDACSSANNYCNNGNMQACQWRDKECSGVVLAVGPGIASNPALPPWLSSGGQSITSACSSANNYCNNGNMQACQWRDKECSNVGYAAATGVGNASEGVGPLCAVEKSEIKNLKTELSDVQRGCDDHVEHLRAELDAAKAMIGAMDVVEAGAMEKDIDSLQLVSPLINSLGPDPSPLTAEEEENDAVRAEIGARMFVTSGDINSVGQFVDHVWKGIGWEWGDSSGFTNTTDTNESDSDNIFGAKYSSISRPNPPPNPPIFKMTESNIRLFRRKFAKRLYYVYYSFVLSDLSVVLKVCPDIAMHGSSETRSDSKFKESLKIYCGKEAGGFMERELGHHITILDNIRSEIDKYGGVVPPIQLIGQLKNLRSNFNRQMDMIKDKGFNYAKVTEAMSEGELEDIEVEPVDFNVPTENEQRPVDKFETMVLSGKNRPSGIPDDIYKAAIQISFMSKQVCLNTEATKNIINSMQGSAPARLPVHSARAVFNCRFHRMDVFFDSVNKMIDASEPDRAAVMDALASKADRDENLAETNLWPGWRELSTQHFNEVRNRRAQMDMDLHVMWVTRENSKPYPPSNPTEEDWEEYNSTPTMSEAELEQIRYNMARDYSHQSIPGIDYETMVNLLVTFNRWDFDARHRPSETQGISAEGVGRGIGGPAEGTGGPAESVVREDIVLPPDTDVETFTVKAKEVILTIVRDETMPDWVYETIPVGVREEINSEHGLSLNTAKWSEIFHAMEPTNPEGLLSRGDPRDVSLIIWQRKQIMTIVSYVLRHLKNNEEWIISTMGELMAGNYKSNEYVSLAVEFFTLLGKSVGLEQNSDPNLGTLGARLTVLTADKVTLNETITELQASLAAKTCDVVIEKLDAAKAEVIDEAVEVITTLDSVTKKLTTQKKELETKLKKAEEDLAMRNKIIIGLAVFIFILIIVLLIK